MKFFDQIMSLFDKPSNFVRIILTGQSEKVEAFLGTQFESTFEQQYSYWFCFISIDWMAKMNALLFLILQKLPLLIGIFWSKQKRDRERERKWNNTPISQAYKIHFIKMPLILDQNRSYKFYVIAHACLLACDWLYWTI